MHSAGDRPSPLHELELIELHDAIVERVSITRHGEVAIELSHLPVYHRETPDTCGVWSFRAELRIDGVESLALNGTVPRHEAESLQDATIIAHGGGRLDPTSLAAGDSVPIDSIELTWALTGTKAVFRGGNLRLRQLEPVRRVETWTGELGGEPP